MTTTLQRRPGTSSLRIEPTGWTAPEGSHVFAFGCDEPGREGYFLPDDSASIAQTDGYGGAYFIRARARLRGPEVAPPAGWFWEAYSRVDAIEPWSFELLPGETRDLTDLAIDTQSFGGGDITLGFGLRVVGPPGAEAVDLEIPAFYLDEIVLDTLDAGLIVANRSPEHDATGVLRDATIHFDLMDTTSSPDPGHTQVWVDGVLAWNGGGGAQPGYVVTTTVVYGGVLRFKIVAPYLFESLREVPIRVASQNLLETHLLDETWSFVVEDLTAPHVVAAVSRSHTTVRVTFDEPVEGATVAAAYAFERLEAPSVNVVAVSVEQVSPTEYDVELDLPITRGTLYRVVVSDVEDEHGNVIATPYDRAEFRGYECPVPAGRRFELWKMIPQMNRDDDSSRDLYKTIAVMQEVVDLLLCDVDEWTEILDVDVAAERYLDQMLIGLGNPFSFDLDVGEKRRLVRSLVDVYRLKGTGSGIIAVVRFFLGLEVTIAAPTDDVWILGVSELGFDTILGPGTSRERYSFNIVSPATLTDEQRLQVRTIAEYMKPAHTHLVQIVEPEDIVAIDHLELGLSELGGDEWMLH